MCMREREKGERERQGGRGVNDKREKTLHPVTGGSISMETERKELPLNAT